MKIEWAEPAELDLGDIYAYIARDVPIYAEQLIDRIIETVYLLHEQPLMGREVPEAEREDVRELIFQNYRIIYLVKDDYLYIVAVIHGSRDLTRMDHKPWEVA
jgi:addiction module RelE/StbE family toxin